MSVLSVVGVEKNFPARNGEITVLEDINFEVEQGEVVLIRGRSGAGKSTLLNIICGLEKASSGQVVFNGNDITKMSLSKLAELRATEIGMIFQSFNLIPTWTALENVESVLMHRGMARSEREEKAKKILKELGLQDRYENLPAELSVGQQQRVAIARTLVNSPKLILADEPTGDVDQETASEIMEMLINRVKQDKVAMIIVSHGVFDDKYADKILYLKDGKFIEEKEK